MKRPSFQFYPADFVIDPGLSTLDYFSIGVFIKLLCFASQAGGELRYREGGKPLTITDLSVLLGLEGNKTEKVINTLLDHGCLKVREDDGCLYNSRMVKDYKEAQEYHEERKRIAEKAASVRWMQKASDKHCINDASSNASSIPQASDKHCINDAYSSSSSTSININTLSNAQAREAKLPTSEKEAVAMCAGIGVPDDFILTKAYPRAVAVGFVDRGSRIVNWPQWVKNYWCASDNSRRREQSKPQARVDEPREVIHLKRLN